MIPEKVELHKQSRQLELVYGQNEIHRLDAEFLRVHSPSAEVRGHGPGQEVLQFGKKNVGIHSISSVGHYALQISFDDDHDSGIYSWEYLRHLCENRESLWQDYLQLLEQQGKSRDPDVQVIQLFDPDVQ